MFAADTLTTVLLFYLGSRYPYLQRKRKRDAVMNRAIQPLSPDPENLVIVYERDEYGRVIEAIKVEWKPICDVDGCENEAKQVHHKNYDNIGREPLEDLQALCKKCHAERH